MTLDEVARSLPNGFHDSEVRRIAVEFQVRTVTFEIDVWIGDIDVPGSAGREIYRAARLELRRFAYLVLEAPDARYPYSDAKPITIDIVPDETPPVVADACFAARMFVAEWNAFIRVAAREAELSWTDEPHDRRSRLPRQPSN